MATDTQTAPSLGEIMIMYASILPSRCQIELESTEIIIDSRSPSVLTWLQQCRDQGIDLASNHTEAIMMWLSRAEAPRFDEVETLWGFEPVVMNGS
ncbi:MAG: hypothetical protein DI542_16500 [Acinetobacter johnsonii]|uniref:Uncharacterized protein n=1 Tax=Acinetobacter johnsonii TaxID=40214 RepID=A0A2W5R592_ACIJO|nr:hypothetical protein [Aeromonas caviae]MDH1843128.1 hypothetical protein [Aeromonas caviae]PZQ85148.1 MAG: hypothetical protein DI542_16500 [Acinetobacter johnsonii]